MDRHVLSLYGEPHGENSDLLYLRDAQADRKGEQVGALPRIPVDEDVRRRTYAPAVRQEVGCEVLAFELAYRVGPGATDRPPLLRENPDNVFFTQVADNARGTQLPFVLSEPKYS
jgi:hypothetical protein